MYSNPKMRNFPYRVHVRVLLRTKFNSINENDNHNVVIDDRRKNKHNFPEKKT